MQFTKPDWREADAAGKGAGMERHVASGKDWPDRKDTGKRVEMEYQDGRKFVGRLDIEDTILAGGEEEPLFVIIDDDDRRRGLSSAVRWRFIGH
jgi:hypothetical protein